MCIFKNILKCACKMNIKLMENNHVLSYIEPFVTGEKCQGMPQYREIRGSDTARYAAIERDITEPYCQVSGYTA